MARRKNVTVDFDIDTSKLVNEEDLSKILFLTMQDAEQRAVRKAPVDTGRLRNSIQLVPSLPGAKEYVLRDGVRYGRFQEQKNPFMRPAVFEAKEFTLPRVTERVLRQNQREG